MLANARARKDFLNFACALAPTTFEHVLAHLFCLEYHSSGFACLAPADRTQLNQQNTMPAFHRNALVAALLASAATVEGFAPVGSTPRTAAAPLSNNANDGSSSTTALSAIDPSAIFPAALFGGAVFATVQFSDKETSVADAVAKKKKDTSSTSTSTATIEKEPVVAEEKVVEEDKEAEPAPTPAPAKDERKYEFTTPAAKRKKEAKVEAPAPVPAPAPVAPKAATPANKDISEIRNEVASTLDSRKEMQKRLDDAKASRDAAKSKEEPAAVEVAEEDVAEEDTAAAVEEADDDDSEEKVTGRKRRFVGKVVKKVVMPWKKWNSL